MSTYFSVHFGTIQNGRYIKFKTRNKKLDIKAFYSIKYHTMNIAINRNIFSIGRNNRKA